MTRLEYAKDYQGRGYAPLPLPLKAKSPGFNGRQKYQPVNGQLERDQPARRQLLSRAFIRLASVTSGKAN